MKKIGAPQSYSTTMPTRGTRLRKIALPEIAPLQGVKLAQGGQPQSAADVWDEISYILHPFADGGLATIAGTLARNAKLRASGRTVDEMSRGPGGKRLGERFDAGHWWRRHPEGYETHFGTESDEAYRRKLDEIRDLSNRMRDREEFAEGGNVSIDEGNRARRSGFLSHAAGFPHMADGGDLSSAFFEMMNAPHRRKIGTSGNVFEGADLSDVPPVRTPDWNSMRTGKYPSVSDRGNLWPWSQADFSGPTGELSPYPRSAAREDSAGEDLLNRMRAPRPTNWREILGEMALGMINPLDPTSFGPMAFSKAIRSAGAQGAAGLAAMIPNKGSIAETMSDDMGFSDPDHPRYRARVRAYPERLRSTLHRGFGE